MKKITVLLMALSLAQLGQSQIISQYVETDSGTTPKGIEIWNNTASALDFSTNPLVIEKGTNGAAPSEDFTINTGTLPVNEVLIIGTSDMEASATTNGVSYFEKPFTFNGDDALVVKYNGIITDVFGVPETDPGSAWSGNGVFTANQNIQLVSGIFEGNLTGFTDPSTRFETVNTSPSGVDGLEGFGIAPENIQQPEFEITEIFSGQSGTDLTADWFEIENTSSVDWNPATHGDLYYDDESADAVTADLVEGLTGLAAGEIAIVLITGNSADVTEFENVWSQVIDLTDVQVGYTDGSGLGGGGDTANLWLGDPLTSSVIAAGSYPDTNSNDGQTYDVDLGEFSVVGNANGAVETIATAGDSGTTPNIGSPGNGPAVQLNFLDFQSTVLSVDEDASSVILSVVLSSAVTSDITFDVSEVSGGTAENGTHFDFTDQNFTLLAGQTTFDISIDITDNTTDNEDVFFALELSNSNEAQLGVNTLAAVYILDDDDVIPQADESILGLNLVTSYTVDANGTAEITAYDATSERLFVVNDTKIEILDFSNPTMPSSVGTIDITTFGASAQSVDVKDGLVAIAVSNTTETDNGVVLFTDIDGNNAQTLEVGALPDMLVFTPDGLRLLVANEGQPSDDYSVDPEGSISVIDVSSGLGNMTQSDVTSLNFNAFDSEKASLIAQDIRIYGPGATVSQDVEPEYITVDENSEKAYVSLQENNAYAIVNLVNLNIESIKPFGLKDHSLPRNSLDTSDETDFIFDATWPIKGMYMPDAIASYAVNGITYIVTANEGDAREYNAYEEEAKITDAEYILDPTVFNNIDLLELSSNLAEINVTLASGDRNNDGLYEEIHVFGGRSFSIYEADNANQVYDSGNEFAKITASDPVYGAIFNASNSNNNFKNRSDNKGVEPEGIIAQEIGGKVYAFVLLERIGGVMVYDITDPANPFFIDYKNNRGAIEGADESGDLGPEGILYIAPEDNSLDKALIVISNEVSSTLSIYSLDNVTLSTNSFENLDNFSFYPNPVRTKINLEIEDNYKVYNLNGQLISTHETTSEIDLSSLKSGIYILQNSAGEAKKLIKL